MYLDVEVDGAFRAEIAGGGNEAGAGKFPSEPDRVEARTLPLRGHGAPEMSGHFVTVAHHRARDMACQASDGQNLQALTQARVAARYIRNQSDQSRSTSES